MRSPTFSSISHVTLSPNEQTMACANDTYIDLYHIYLDRTLCRLSGHFDTISSLVWSPDGHTLASGSHDKTIRLWNPNTGHRNCRAQDGHSQRDRLGTTAPSQFNRLGKLILLQPELIDAYASALVKAVKNEADGLGSIAEIRVQAGDFPLPESERIKDEAQERLLLLAMIEDLLRRELALREEGLLIFPSRSTREYSDPAEPIEKTIIFAFDGSVSNIYATLAVRLAHSDCFKKEDVWKNAITYTTNSGGICGLFLQNSGDGRGMLTLFFDKSTGQETRLSFEGYVYHHLQQRALPESLKLRRLFTCNSCSEAVGDEVIRAREERSFNWFYCSNCGERTFFGGQQVGDVEQLSPHILEMERAADVESVRQANLSVVAGKQASQDFDVFLCHHNVDKPAVKKIGEQLKARGLLPWLDEWELQPGLPWQLLLEKQIDKIKSAAVFIGKDGIGPWEQMELNAFLREFVRRGCSVIPVILADAPKEPQLPIFLQGMTWVDFRKQDPAPLNQLIWGITGKR